MLKNFFLLVLFTFECTVLSRGNESFQNLDKESESCVRTCATDPYTFKVNVGYKYFVLYTFNFTLLDLSERIFYSFNPKNKVFFDFY